MVGHRQPRARHARPGRLPPAERSARHPGTVAGRRARVLPARGDARVRRSADAPAARHCGRGRARGLCLSPRSTRPPRQWQQSRPTLCLSPCPRLWPKQWRGVPDVGPGNAHARKAERKYAADLAEGRLPSLRAVMRDIGVGQDKAREVRAAPRQPRDGQRAGEPWLRSSTTRVPLG